MKSEWLLPERWLPLGLLLVAVSAVPASVVSPSGLPRLRHLEQERLRTEEQISRLSQEISELRAEVEQIKSDPAAVERVARDELGLVRPNEFVFQFGR